MKKFLCRFLYFVLPIVVLAYPLDVLISHYLKRSNTYAQSEYAVWNDLFAHHINSDVVIYGSSRAWVHVDPAVVTDSLHATAYNLGMDGQNFSMQYLRHRMLLRYNTTPRLIIHSIDLFSLQKKPGLYNVEQFLPYILWNSELDSTVMAYKGLDRFDSKIPLVRYYGRAKAVYAATKVMKAGAGKPKRVRGYEGQNRKWNSDLKKAKQSRSFYAIDIDPELVNMYERFLQECKQKGIQVIMVYAPEYIEGQEFVKNRKEVFELFMGFSKKYNVPFHDFSKDSLSYNKEYFYNASHLNKTGSGLFTQNLVTQIKADLDSMDYKLRQ